MTHRLNLILLALFVIVIAPSYWLLFDNRVSDVPAKPIAIADLRRLAGSIPGPAPSAVEVQSVAHRSIPQTVLAAGTGFRLQHMDVMAFRLPVAGDRAVVIDTGLTRQEAADIGMTAYSAGAQARVNAAMRAAGLILVTHEHTDHMGGLAALAGDPSILAKARLSPAQVADGALGRGAPWPRDAVPVASLAGSGLQAVAPGIVVIPAPGHTPGSQMIFVRLADGHEYLFTGDVAASQANWAQLRMRSRLVAELVSPSDRDQIFAWLRTIRRLTQQAPALTIITAHELPRLPRFGASTTQYPAGK